MTSKTKAEVVQAFRIETIREAATRVISREGLGGATMQRIAEEAGIAKGTIYLYFKDRNDLIEKTADHTFSLIIEEIRGVFDESCTFRAQLSRLVEKLFTFFGSNRDFFRLYFAVRYPAGDVSHQNRHERPQIVQYQTYLQILEEQLVRAMESGELRRLPAEPLALFLAEGINGLLIQRIQESQTETDSQDWDWIVEAMLDGIATSIDGEAR